MKTAITTIVATLATATTALAAAGARVDHSGFLVWAFLGLCALIVVAQLAPAAVMVVGMIKGLVETRGEAKATVRH